MDNSAGQNASLEGRYASALYALAQERGAASAVEGDLALLAQAVRDNADLSALIRSPQVSRSAAGGAMAGIAGLLKLNPVTTNFLGVLAENRRLAALPAILAAFAAIAAAARGEVNADVTSAHPLSAAQIKTLADKLKTRAGKDVTVSARVDPELLGGLVVRIGSEQIDSSIRTRLTSLAQHIAG